MGIEEIIAHGLNLLGRFRTAVKLHRQKSGSRALMQSLLAEQPGPGQENPATSRNIAVVVPVYNGIGETRRCLDSLVNSPVMIPFEAIVINDASPEPGMEALLSSYAEKNDRFRVVKNETNLGFVRSVNKGIRLAGDADVVLLNSDTEVAPGWLDRLAGQACRDDRVGTVTPFSNNATICSYPDLDGWQHLPPGETVHSLDKAFAAANPGMAVEIPTAVGFCMYIRRDCLNEMGLFDEQAFGTGYGEENDFCYRAMQKGWKNILAADVFVFHEGEVSFGHAAAEQKAKAMDTLKKLHPDYLKAVSRHIRQNPAYPHRLRATAARCRLSGKPVTLMITHALGGGTDRHIRELSEKLTSTGEKVLLLRPAGQMNEPFVNLESFSVNDRLKVCLSTADMPLLVKVLESFGISRIHIHHTNGLPFPAEELVRLSGLPFAVTIHDYYFICPPRINMIRPGKGFCGKPTAEDCRHCLATKPKVIGINITRWRSGFESLLKRAEKVYCPSHDCSARIRDFFPGIDPVVVPHEELRLPPPVKFTSTGNKKRFAILGVLNDHKGYGLVKEMLKKIDHEDLPIEFYLIGYTVKPLRSRSFTQTGPYEDDQLYRLIEAHNPDAILFPARWPETYSYTLSEALLTGRPVIVPDIGAFPERVESVSNAFVFPHDISPEALVEYLLTLPQGN